MRLRFYLFPLCNISPLSSLFVMKCIEDLAEQYPGLYLQVMIIMIMIIGANHSSGCSVLFSSLVKVIKYLQFICQHIFALYAGR